MQHAWGVVGGDKRIAVTEYGAGANPAQHQEGALTQPKPGGPWHPEEWQSHLHARIWDQARNNPHLWGTFLWAMFDFAVDSRDEGETPGITSATAICMVVSQGSQRVRRLRRNRNQCRPKVAIHLQNHTLNLSGICGGPSS